MYPCKRCSKHFLSLIEIYKMEFKTRDDVVEWLCNIHNVINMNKDKEKYNCDKIWENYEMIK